MYVHGVCGAWAGTMVTMLVGLYTFSLELQIQGLAQIAPGNVKILSYRSFTVRIPHVDSPISRLVHTSSGFLATTLRGVDTGFNPSACTKVLVVLDLTVQYLERAERMTGIVSRSADISLDLRL